MEAPVGLGELYEVQTACDRGILTGKWMDREEKTV